MRIEPWGTRILRLLGLAGVFAAGWVTKALLDPASTEAALRAVTERTVTTPPRDPQQPVSAQSAVAPEVAMENRPEAAMSEAERMKAEIAAMTPEQFAHELAALLRSHQTTPANLKRKVALLEGLDAERAVTTYLEYKRLYGIGIDSEAGQPLRDILTAAGSRDGARMAELLLAESPGGIAEFNSFVHGWALGNSEEAVAWFNSLPLDHPMYDKTLRGLFWGLAEADLGYSIDAFNALDLGAMRPNDLASAGSSLALSMMNTHGIDGMNRWFQELPEDMHVRAAEWSTLNMVSQPLEEVVPWLSGYAGQSETLHHALQQHASRWAGTSPEAAMEWAGTFASNQPDSPLGGEMFRITAGKVSRDVLTRWIAQNPGHPELPTATELLHAAGDSCEPPR